MYRVRRNREHALRRDRVLRAPIAPWVPTHRELREAIEAAVGGRGGGIGAA